MRTEPGGGGAAAGIGTGGAAIEARGLDVGYGRHVVVRDVRVAAAPGALVALIGTNGSGKSTLLKTLAGMIAPLGGEARVLGAAPGASARRVAYLPQHPASSHTLPLRARDVVAMGRYAHLGLLRREGVADRRARDAAMARTGADAYAALPLRELSGGQQQRVHLAQVLAREAEVLLLDEPTAGLDVAGRAAVMAIVEAERARGVTVVMSTHDLGDAERASHVLLLAQRVVAAGAPREVLTDEHLRACFGFTQLH